VRHLLLILGFLIFSANSAYAADDSQCTTDKAMKAEALPNIKQWDDFYTAYQSYGVCDDGSIAEGFSDSAAKMLANHWDQIGIFIALSAKDQGFRDFIVGHIDETDDLNDISRIIWNARNMCPAGAKGLCKALEVQAIHPDISGWLGYMPATKKPKAVVTLYISPKTMYSLQGI